MNNQVAQTAESMFRLNNISAMNMGSASTLGIGERDRGGAPAFSVEKGNAVIRHWDTGNLIPDFDGIAYDYMARMFILIGTHNGDRSFDYLFSANYRDAQNEAEIRKKKNAEAWPGLPA